jgi:hypothetical protein
MDDQSPETESAPDVTEWLEDDDDDGEDVYPLFV